MDQAKYIVVNVVGWNSLVYLPQLLASLDAQTLREFTLTVIDNASTDGTTRWLQSSRPDVTVLRNFRNQGFARGHNQAITLAFSRWPEEMLMNRYIVVANPDLEFDPDCLRRMFEAMEADPTIDACGPKLLRARAIAGGDEIERETERTNVIDSTGLVMKRSRRVFDRGAGEEDKGQYDAQTEVFGFSGACVMFRASSLERAKLAGEFFDEDFFAYKEDVDLAWRMKRLGMRAVYVPSAVAWHHRGSPSTQKGIMDAWKLRMAKPAHVNTLSTRNHVWVSWKNDEVFNRLLAAPWIVPYELGKFLAALISPSSLRGMVQTPLGSLKMWKKRMELSRRAKVSGGRMRKWFV